MEQETRQSYIKRLWNANTADEISEILDEYDAKGLPKKPEPNWGEAPDWAQWWAVDDCGDAWWLTHQPMYNFKGKLVNIDADGMIAFNKSINLKGYDWRKTPIKRP